MTLSPPTPTPPEGPDADACAARRARSFAFPLLVLVPLVLFIQGRDATPIPSPGADGPNAARLDPRLDPNTAPWWELTALPRLGDTLAQRIVAYRTEHLARTGQPAFRTADDLTAVRGIGPKTVAQLRPYLALPAPVVPTISN